MSVLHLQVCKAEVKSSGDGILSGVIWPVGKLEGVKYGKEYGGDVLLYQSFKALHHNRSECYEPVVIKGVVIRGFFGTGMMVAVLKHDGTLA